MKTSQRKAIVNYFKNKNSHPTAREIYEAVSSKNGMISLTTFYNTLSFMKKKGIVRELAIANFDHKIFRRWTKNRCQNVVHKNKGGSFNKPA